MEEYSKIYKYYIDIGILVVIIFQLFHKFNYTKNNYYEDL